MKKLYNVIFPIWLILIIPPIVLLVIPSNFIIDSLVLLIGFKMLNITNWFDKYKKSIIKVWGFGFVVDILGSLLLLVTQFMGTDGYLYENLVYPLVWNPFKSVIAVLYVLVVVVICGLLIYIINYEFSFKKTDLDNKGKRTISILLACITAPYLFFFPTSYLYERKTNNLDDYQNSYIGDNSAIGNIISDIYSGDYMESFSLNSEEIPYGVTITYKVDLYGDIYQYLEQDASILFKLVTNVDYVEFKVNSNSYMFDKKYVDSLYDNIKELEIEDIYSRYDHEYFEKFTYLGHIDNYDIFDTSTTCGIDKNIIYTDSEYNYYIECSDIDAIYLVNGNIKKKVKTALEQNEINVQTLFQTNLKISKEDINEISSE